MKNQLPLEKENIEYFQKHNERYDKGAFAGSEAQKYNLEVIKKWIDIREEFSFTEECSEYSADLERNRHHRWLAHKVWDWIHLCK